MDSSPKSPRPTSTLLFAVFIVTLGTWFAGGFVNVALNVPQQFIVKWIREVECSRRHTPGPGHDDNHTTSHRLWCREVPTEEEHLLLRDNIELNAIWAVANSVVQAGIILSTLTCSYLIHRFGPKGVIYIASGTFLTGAFLSALISAIHVYELLIIGRFFTGMAQGLTGIATTLYVSEIAPVKLRGAFSTVPVVMMVLGMLFINVLGFPQVLGTEIHWRTMLAMESIPVIIMCLFLPFCPETPRRLFLIQGDKEGAIKSLQWLRRKVNVDDELFEMQREAAMLEIHNTFSRVSIWGIFKDPYLRYIMGICAVPTVAKMLSGYMCILYYSTAIFKSVGFDHEYSAYATCLLWIVFLLFTLISMSFVDSMGRKNLLIVSHSGMVICLATFAVFQILTAHCDVTWTTYGSAICIICFMATYALGSGSVPWFLPSELFSQEARSSAMTINAVLGVTTGLATTLLFPLVVFVLEEYTFFIFVTCVSLATVHIVWKLPETKGKTIDEIQAMLRLSFLTK